MKRARIIFIMVLCMMAGFVSTAAASRSSISVGVGFGYYPGYYDGWRHCGGYGPYGYYGPSGCRGWGYYGYYYRPWYRRNCYPYRETVIIDRAHWYERDRDYCLVDKPLIYEEYTYVLNPNPVEKDTQELFKTLRNKKNELLTQLKTGDANQCREAINELSGFSFDDTVRAALEDVLLNNPDAEMRAQAAQMFGNVRNIKAMPSLEKARVEDAKEEVRKAADEAIKKIQGRSS